MYDRLWESRYIHCYRPFAFLINRMIRRSRYSQEWFWRSGRTVRYCWGGTPFKWRTPNSQSCQDGTTRTISKSFNESSTPVWSWFTRFWYSGHDYKIWSVTWTVRVRGYLIGVYNPCRIFHSRVQTQVHTTAHLQILQIHPHLRNILPTHAARILRPIRHD